MLQRKTKDKAKLAPFFRVPLSKDLWIAEIQVGLLLYPVRHENSPRTFTQQQQKTENQHQLIKAYAGNNKALPAGLQKTQTQMVKPALAEGYVVSHQATRGRSPRTVAQSRRSSLRRRLQ